MWLLGKDFKLKVVTVFKYIYNGVSRLVMKTTSLEGFQAFASKERFLRNELIIIWNSKFLDFRQTQSLCNWISFTLVLRNAKRKKNTPS